MRNNKPYSFPVDAIFMWVDGSQPEWQHQKEQKKHEIMARMPKVRFADGQERYRNNDELRYSLRSLAQYAPWVNRVFLVTNGQCPAWLNTNTVTLVQHKDILPPEVDTPVFSNRPVEMCLHNIPQLAEHFITFNDDFMLGRPVSRTYFFSQHGMPFVDCLRNRIAFISWLNLPWMRSRAVPDLYWQSVRQAHNCLHQKFGKRYPYHIGHYPRAGTVSSMHGFWQTFPEAIAKTLQTPIRTGFDISLYPLYSFYLLAVGQGRKRVVNTLWRKATGRFLHLGGHMEAAVNCAGYERVLLRIQQRRPTTFCLNDSPQATATAQERTRRFLQAYFPEPSKFEQ